MSGHGSMKFLILALTLVLAGCGDRADSQENGAPERPAVAVQTVAVEPMTLTETVRGIGSLRAQATVQISPEIAGRVTALHFTEGGPVEAGQTLVELEDDKLSRTLAARRAALRAAEAQSASSRRTYQRQAELLEEGIVSRQEYETTQAERDSTQAEVERLRAEVALVEAQLADTRIVAPFTGVISERHVDLGAYVAVGDVLATLYRVDPIELEFAVPERHLGRIREGQPVTVTVSAWPDEEFLGSVTYVSPAVRVATRDFMVRASIPNPDNRLTPGGSATATVTVGSRPDRPVVPEEALVGTRIGYIVFVVEDGIARSREVELGMREGPLAEVVRGLAVGERVVRQGHLRLSGGERVVEAAEPAESATAPPVAAEVEATP